MRAVTDHDQRRIPRPVRLPVEVAHLVHGYLLEAASLPIARCPYG